MIYRLGICLVLLGLLLALPFYFRKNEELPPPSADCDVVVVISAHNKSVRDEYERAFRKYYRNKTGRDVRIDFRSPGGTSDIVRYINDRFINEFRLFCGDGWKPEYAAIFNDPKQQEHPIRQKFLQSDVGIGIDVFAGGGTFVHQRTAAAGYAVDGGVRQRHPEYFAPEVIPAKFGGEMMYDPQGRYYGVVLSTFGIFCNYDRLNELNDKSVPIRWSDLAEGRFFNGLVVADPSKSGSANKCYEIIVQQCMAQAGNPADGWRNGLNLLKRIFANARNVTDSASKVVSDVARGEAIAGTAIDTYGFAEENWSEHCFGKSRVVYITPRGGTAVGADPVQILRGAPNRKVAEHFVDFLLSPEGQALHCFKAGTAGGPAKTTLNRPPVRQDLYTAENRSKMFRPGYNPYASGADFEYKPQWTGRYYSLLSRVIKSIMLDPQPELQAAWRAILAAGGPDKVPEAMAYFNRLPFEYRDAGEAAAALKKSPAEVAALLRKWNVEAAGNYRMAEKLAKEGR